MLRATIHATPATDVESEVSKLRQQCAAQSMPLHSSEELAGQVQKILSLLVEQGQRMAAQGSRLEASRDIEGENYRVRVRFEMNEHASLFSRILGIFRRG